MRTNIVRLKKGYQPKENNNREFFQILDAEQKSEKNNKNNATFPPKGGNVAQKD